MVECWWPQLHHLLRSSHYLRHRIQMSIVKNMKFLNERVDDEVENTMTMAVKAKFFPDYTRFSKVWNNCCIRFVYDFSNVHHPNYGHCCEDQSVP